MESAAYEGTDLLEACDDDILVVYSDAGSAASAIDTLADFLREHGIAARRGTASPPMFALHSENHTYSGVEAAVRTHPRWSAGGEVVLDYLGGVVYYEIVGDVREDGFGDEAATGLAPDPATALAALNMLTCCFDICRGTLP